jgi:tRNA threonylcarbamoyladenosine biosynthesis protein TsaE
MKSAVYTTKVDDLNLVAKHVVDTLNDVHKNTASVVFLNGDLGAGKTTFSQEVAKYLGVDDKVVSPTFILKKEYKTTHPRFKKLIHIDAYRFNDPREARVLRLEDDLERSENLIIIEWPEKIPPVQNDITVSFEVVDETTRDVKIEYED